MKNQALFSSKDKSKKLKCLLQFLFGALRVNWGRTRDKDTAFIKVYDCTSKWDNSHLYVVLSLLTWWMLFLKERLCSQREQILSFKSSTHRRNSQCGKRTYFAAVVPLDKLAVKPQKRNHTN